MEIIELKCRECKKVFIVGQRVVGIRTEDGISLPFHSFCAQKKIKGENTDGVVIHSSKHQRKMVREAQKLGI